MKNQSFVFFFTETVNQFDVGCNVVTCSGGPLPEELLPQVQCPVRILWGERDPWEPINLGREFAKYDCVDEFVPLAGTSIDPYINSNI